NTDPSSIPKWVLAMSQVYGAYYPSRIRKMRECCMGLWGPRCASGRQYEALLVTSPLPAEFAPVAVNEPGDPHLKPGFGCSSHIRGCSPLGISLVNPGRYVGDNRIDNRIYRH